MCSTSGNWNVIQVDRHINANKYGSSWRWRKFWPEGVSGKNMSSIDRSLILQMFQKFITRQKCWSFSTVVDTDTDNGDSHLDLRLRIFSKNKIWNYYIMSVQFKETNTGFNLMDQCSSKSDSNICFNSSCLKCWSRY